MGRQKSGRSKAPLNGEHYTNRELSWLRFNERVLEEAENASNPLIERLKFLAIFESNLDEFYMVRVSGLIEQVAAGISETSPDGLTAREQLQVIEEMAHPLRRRAGMHWQDVLRPQLEQSGITIRRVDELSEADRASLDAYFMREVFPVCTPLLLHPAHNVPFISNRSLNLAVLLHDPASGAKLGRVKIPSVVPRFVRVTKRRNEYVLIEDLIKANLRHLFLGVQIRGAHPFRVLRDADIEIRELEAADLITSIEKTIHMRRFGDPVLLQVSPTMPRETIRTLMRLLELDQEDVMELPDMLSLDSLWDLTSVDKPSLRYAPHTPFTSDKFSSPRNIFDAISEKDVLVHHPYDSFRSVEEFVSSAAQDPLVVGIKQTLYRVGEKSPIVDSLMAAATAGKQVAVLVELKARFDESNNLTWARALERAGVHVTFGFTELKTHAKLCSIVRREPGGLMTYAHIGTGNYNPATARVYTDLGLFTCDPEITQDISELFNFLTGFSKQQTYRKLLVAPINLREGIIDRIERETRHHRRHGGGRIIFKQNALVDPEVVDSLYEASGAGVQVDLIVRGICCLQPGIPGVSENIRVCSVVGRFLEHSRVYYFGNHGTPEVFIGSADLMRRNLDRRVEALVPVEDPRLIQLVREQVLDPVFHDNTNAWELDSQGIYHRRKAGQEKDRFSSQQYAINHPLTQIQFPGA
ncbi:MAG: polyphosphate kinase 1 [Chthonomonas sp.]|nr:polyphosphate kinase 1 [Chthonomonas sp.]